MFAYCTLLKHKMPRMALPPETTPLMMTSYMLGSYEKNRSEWWWDKRVNEFDEEYKERSKEETWPYKEEGWIKLGRDVLPKWYSKDALKEALAMIPPHFDTADIPRPPQRIKAQSEGIVGRWYTNYWTLHSIRFQCQLANIPWKYGKRIRPRSNYDEPYFFVDYEESKMIRDHRSKWINVNRSMVNSTKQVYDIEQQDREAEHKKKQSSYWTNRKVFINRLKAMRAQGTIDENKQIWAAKHINFKILNEEMSIST